MNAEQERAFNRLVKKLGSLRVTLRKDERDILDAIVLSTPEQVLDGEVSFHAMADAKQEAQADAASEVSFHAMADASQDKYADRVTYRYNSKIVLDDESQTYRIVSRSSM